MSQDSGSKPLPSFHKPPVVEVALGVQFEALSELNTGKTGLLWSRYRKDFPVVQDHPLLDRVVETFDAKPSSVKVELELVNRPPRTWFMSSAEDHVIQIQQDRFVVNWRKLEKEYPRFPHVLNLFTESFGKFLEFIEKEQVGRFSPNQCEVTYVNHLPVGSGWEKVGEVNRVLSSWGGYSDDFLPPPEATRVQNKFLIRNAAEEPIGRLHADLRTSQERDGRNSMVLNLTARGRPLSDNKDGVLAFFELGREWVVRGFASYTTPEMHSIWERYE